MSWVWCDDLGGWAAHAGTIPAGATYPVDDSNDPDLETGSFIPVGGGEIDLISGSDSFDPCTWTWGVDFVGYWNAGSYDWQPTGLGGTGPSGTDLYVVVFGPSFDDTDPEPAWDPSDALGWLSTPAPADPTQPIRHVLSASTTFELNMGISADYGLFAVGDFLILQVIRHWASGATTIPTPDGWTLLHAENSSEALWLLAWRWCPPGDETIDMLVAYGAVTGYRNVDPVNPIADFAAPAGTLDVPVPGCVAVDFAFDQSSSPSFYSFEFGNRARYAEVDGGHGQALADTARSEDDSTVAVVVDVGTRSPVTWIMVDPDHEEVDPMPGTSTFANLLLRPRTGGWGVGQIRMGA